MSVKKHTSNTFRVRSDSRDIGYFGQVKKAVNGSWHAEIRENDTGDIHRMAGIWRTKKEAVAECMFIIDPEYRARELNEA
jgi:hypothetical protein